MEVNDVLSDRYQLQQRLSDGRGETFLARDLRSQSLAVVKILSFYGDFEWNDPKLFEREALALQDLDRPEIPQYLDYFEVNTVDTRGFALVQSYVDAPSLETQIQQGRKFSEAETIALADRVLDTLIYLHQQNPPVIHRDIKPSNILLSDRDGSIGDVYLVDFGVVGRLVSSTEANCTMLGLPYICTERRWGRAIPASDLYGLGMTLIHLRTGLHPDELPLFEEPLDLGDKISRRLTCWLEKMIQHYPSRRFGSAELARVILNLEVVGNDR